jgi:hypothetical protein
LSLNNASKISELVLSRTSFILVKSAAFLYKKFQSHGNFKCVVLTASIIIALMMEVISTSEIFG